MIPPAMSTYSEIRAIPTTVMHVLVHIFGNPPVGRPGLGKDKRSVHRYKYLCWHCTLMPSCEAPMQSSGRGVVDLTLQPAGKEPFLQHLSALFAPDKRVSRLAAIAA